MILRIALPLLAGALLIGAGCAHTVVIKERGDEQVKWMLMARGRFIPGTLRDSLKDYFGPPDFETGNEMAYVVRVRKNGHIYRVRMIFDENRLVEFKYERLSKYGETML